MPKKKIEKKKEKSVEKKKEKKNESGAEKKGAEKKIEKKKEKKRRAKKEFEVTTDLMQDVRICYLLLDTGERDLFGGDGDWEDWCRWMKWEKLGEGRSRTRKTITLLDPWTPWDVQMEWLRDFEEAIARSADFRNSQCAVEDEHRRDAEDETQSIAAEDWSS